MDEQNRYPDESDAPAGGAAPMGNDHEEHTRPLPPYRQDPVVGAQGPAQGPADGSFYGSPQPGPAPATSASSGRRGTAGVLLAALLLGGVAGIGGAATYDALNDEPTTTSNTSNTTDDFEATKTTVVEDGTVEKVANAVLPSVVKVNVSGRSGAGSGSGIVLSEDGKILTNNHVVAGAGDSGAISVSFNDGTAKKATVVGTDPLTDIAVIQAEGASDLVPAALGKSGTLEVGQSVVAVGSPFGLNATVTSGIVSALHRPVSVSAEQEEPENPFGGESQPGQDLRTTYPAIQTDAAINPGNSGGPLIDMSGRVVGINSSIRTASSGGSIGLGFAIPIDEVLPIVNQINDGETPTHARLGVSVSDSPDALRQGALLREVENGGAADQAGLEVDDVITKLDDHVIDGSESLVATVRGHRPGDEVEITYVRDGKTATTTADLGSDENISAS